MAIAIRQNPNIQGVSCGPQTHKCGLSLDDILLFVISPITSPPNLCKTFDDFATVSGLKVNYTKFQALNISLQNDTVTFLKKSLKFAWSESSIRYFGVVKPWSQ